MSAWLLVLVGATPAPTAWADVSAAILATEEGKRVKQTLAEAEGEAQAEIATGEKRLLELKDPAQYDREAKRLQEQAKQHTDRLEAMQEKLLAPIIAGMKQVLGAHPEVLDLSEQPLLAPPESCNATGWLAETYQKRKANRSSCRFERFAYVSLDRALARSEMGKAATRRLDSMKEQSQIDIDARQRKLAELERAEGARAQLEKERRELAQMFARHQRDLADAEAETEGQLYAKLEKKLAAAAKELPGLVFVEVLDEQQPRLEPSCEVTDWAVRLIDEGAKASELKLLCAVKR